MANMVNEIWPIILRMWEDVAVLIVLYCPPINVNLQQFRKQFRFVYPVFLTLVSCCFHYALIMIRDPFEHGASDVYLVILWFIGAIVGASTAFLLDILLEKKICANLSGLRKRRRVSLLQLFATILSLVSGCILAFERSIISARCLSGFSYGLVVWPAVLDASEIVDVNSRRMRCLIIYMAMPTAVLIGSIVNVSINSYFEECYGFLCMVFAFVGLCGSLSKNSNSYARVLPIHNEINDTQTLAIVGIKKVCWMATIVVERFFYAISISVPLIVQSSTFITRTVIHDKSAVFPLFINLFAVEICGIIICFLLSSKFVNKSLEITYAILIILAAIFVIFVAYFISFKMIPFAIALYQVLCGMNDGLFSAMYLTETYPSGKKKLSIFIIFSIEMAAHIIVNLMVNAGEFFIGYFRYQFLITSLISSVIAMIPIGIALFQFVRNLDVTLSANESSIRNLDEDLLANEHSTEMDEELSANESSTEVLMKTFQ